MDDARVLRAFLIKELIPHLSSNNSAEALVDVSIYLEQYIHTGKKPTAE